MRDGAESLVFVVTSPHPEGVQDSTKDYLIRTKDVSITQEIPRDLGTLCQQPRTETKYILLMMSHTIQ